MRCRVFIGLKGQVSVMDNNFGCVSATCHMAVGPFVSFCDMAASGTLIIIELTHGEHVLVNL